MQSNGFNRKMISGDLKKNIFSNPKGGPLCFQKRKSALVGFFLEKNPMTNKIKKFLYILEHLIPDGRDEIPTFALYHPLLLGERSVLLVTRCKVYLLYIEHQKLRFLKTFFFLLNWFLPLTVSPLFISFKIHILSKSFLSLLFQQYRWRHYALTHH